MKHSSYGGKFDTQWALRSPEDQPDDNHLITTMTSEDDDCSETEDAILEEKTFSWQIDFFNRSARNSKLNSIPPPSSSDHQYLMQTLSDSEEDEDDSDYEDDEQFEPFCDDIAEENENEEEDTQLHMDMAELESSHPPSKKLLPDSNSTPKRPNLVLPGRESHRLHLCRTTNPPGSPLKKQKTPRTFNNSSHRRHHSHQFLPFSPLPPPTPPSSPAVPLCLVLSRDQIQTHHIRQPPASAPVISRNKRRCPQGHFTDVPDMTDEQQLPVVHPTRLWTTPTRPSLDRSVLTRPRRISPATVPTNFYRVVERRRSHHCLTTQTQPPTTLQQTNSLPNNTDITSSRSRHPQTPRSRRKKHYPPPSPHCSPTSQHFSSTSPRRSPVSVIPSHTNNGGETPRGGHFTFEQCVPFRPSLSLSRGSTTVASPRQQSDHTSKKPMVDGILLNPRQGKSDNEPNNPLNVILLRHHIQAGKFGQIEAGASKLCSSCYRSFGPEGIGCYLKKPLCPKCGPMALGRCRKKAHQLECQIPCRFCCRITSWFCRGEIIPDALKCLINCGYCKGQKDDLPTICTHL